MQAGGEGISESADSLQLGLRFLHAGHSSADRKVACIRCNRTTALLSDGLILRINCLSVKFGHALEED